MGNIVQLYDASNNKVYPVTHLRAVRDSSGTTLESMMQDVREIAVGYYECSTPGNTAAKAITIDSSVSLSTKILCKVKFVEKNKVNNATMNINGTGAKALYYNGVRAAANNSWYPNEVVDLYYDGTNYQAKSCADTLEYDVSLHQTHEITEITATTRTLIFNGNVVSSWESETPVSDSSVEGYTRSETNTGQDIDSTTVDGPNATYDSTANKTNVVYVTTHTYTHVVNNYTFEEAVNAVPMSYRHGGLKLRFISNSNDNKYVQYRLMTNDWSTTESDWQGVDDVPTAGSDNLVKSGGVQQELALGAVYDVSAKNPTAGVNNDGKWKSLSALLSDANLSTLIPTPVRKGGMSIKFIQSSNNKYIQYRLMANEWSIDTNDWAIVNEGVYTENSEFLYVKTDSDDKILYGIQKDGNFYFGAGCPQQVKDYVQQKIDAIIGVGDITEKIDTINEMIAFFDTINHDTTLRQLLETSAGSIAIEEERAEAAEQHLDDVKVDKEEGKSLINAEYAEGVHYIESPEFAEIKIDAEGKILEATYKDGTKLFPAGVKVNGAAEYDSATVTTISNPEFAIVWLDNSNRILLGIKNNADILFGCCVPSQIKSYIDKEIDKVSPEGVHELIDFIGEYLGSTTLQELLSKKVDGEYTENPEYAEIKLDSDNKIIEATRKDGIKVLPAGIETPKVNLEGANIENKANPEYVEAKVDEESKLLEGTRTDGTKVIGGNLEVGNNLNVKGDVEVGGNVSYKNGIPQAIIDYVAANTGSGVTNIEYEDETGDMYATFDDADGVTDVYMEENGDIYAEIEK